MYNKGLCFGLLFWFSVCSICWLRQEKSQQVTTRLGKVEQATSQHAAVHGGIVGVLVLFVLVLDESSKACLAHGVLE